MLVFYYTILYSGKVLRGESLANSENCQLFSKLKPSKLVLTITNLLVDLLNHQTLFCQMFKKSKFTELCPTKFSSYMVTATEWRMSYSIIKAPGGTYSHFCFELWRYYNTRKFHKYNHVHLLYKSLIFPLVSSKGMGTSRRAQKLRSNLNSLFLDSVNSTLKCLA